MAGVGCIHKTLTGRVYFMMGLFITQFKVLLTFPGQHVLFSEVLQNRKYSARIYDYETLNCISKQMWR